MRVYKVAIIGGGAAGLLSAMLLGEQFGEDVIVLEKLNRVGKKITVTGNGRGNFTNERVTSKNYHSKEGDAEAFVKPALKAFPNKMVKGLLSSLGALPTTEDGRVYPASFQASSVLDLIRFKLERLKVEIRTEFNVCDIKKEKFYTITAEDGSNVLAASVIIAVGGKCQKQFGTDGSGYALARKLGHHVTECLPSLVQLKTETSYIKALKGVKQEVNLTLLDGTKPITCEKGDLLFTEFGVSGNSVFQISTKAVSLKKPELSIEFLPNFTAEEIIEALNAKIVKTPYLLMEELLTGYVNKQVGRAIVKYAGYDVLEKCTRSAVKKVVKVLKDFRLHVMGTLGFNYAQVTRGGVRLSECDSKTMASLKNDGLFFAGEVLDVDGDCGGYNLQWAFSSAYLASWNIAKIYGVNQEDFGRFIK